MSSHTELMPESDAGSRPESQAPANILQSSLAQQPEAVLQLVHLGVVARLGIAAGVGVRVGVVLQLGHEGA